MTEKRPSEIIQDFLTLLDRAEIEYSDGFSTVGTEDKKVTDFLHKMEFAENKAERNKVATKLQNSRKTRRVGKDKVQLYKNIVDYCAIGKNKDAIKSLRVILNKQYEVEEYLFNPREYKGADNEQ